MMCGSKDGAFHMLLVACVMFPIPSPCASICTLQVQTHNYPLARSCSARPSTRRFTRQWMMTMMGGSKDGAFQSSKTNPTSGSTPVHSQVKPPCFSSSSAQTIVSLPSRASAELHKHCQLLETTCQSSEELFPPKKCEEEMTRSCEGHSLARSPPSPLLSLSLSRSLITIMETYPTI